MKEIIYSREEYNEKRLILLEQLVFRFHRIAEDHFTTNGQKALRDEQCEYQKSIKTLGGIPKPTYKITGRG